MEAINRSAIVVKPAQPFLDWLHRVDPTSAQLTLDDLSLEPTIYLLPECECKEEAIERLREVCTEIFRNSWTAGTGSRQHGLPSATCMRSSYGSSGASIR